MDRTGKLIVIVLLVIAGLLGPAGAQTSALGDQISQHEQKLAAARASGNGRAVGLELIALGYLYRQAGKMDLAMERLNEALSMSRDAGNETGQAMALNTMGRVYSDMGREDKALDLFSQARPLWRSAGIPQGEANALNNMGRAYNELGRREDALKCLNEALAIWRAKSDSGNGPRADPVRLAAMKRLATVMPNVRDAIGRAGEASTLDNLGKTYNEMGLNREALEYFDQALPIWKSEGEQGGEALTLNNMGRAYADLGMKKESLDAYGRSLSTWRAIGNRQGEALTLNNMGRLYRDLGQHKTALDYYNQALPIWREVANRNGEALALNDVGRAYADLGEHRKALEYFDQALPIWHATGARRGEAATLNNAGRSWTQLGDQAKALDLDYRALTVWREVQDLRGEALALACVGWACAGGKEPGRALTADLAALSLAKAAGDPEIEGGIGSALMLHLRDQGRREEAILFGKEAVNAYQSIRRNISGLGKDLQTGFTKSKSATYRVLAELLVQADRLAEAEQVLDMLKEQELKETVRGAAGGSETKTEPLKLSPAQQAAEKEIEAREKTAAALMDSSAEYVALKARSDRTPQDNQRMKTLEAGIETGNAEVSEFFRKTLYPELSGKAGAENANAVLSREKSEVSRLQNTLAELGPGVMGIRVLLGDERAYAIVVTAQGRRKFELKAAPADLRRMVLQVRDDLRNPDSHPKQHLAQLYAMVVGPFESELTALERSFQGGSGAPTILWSLDGALRYVPMAAMYDGRRFLAERFTNVLFTPESYGHMAASAGEGRPALRVLAMGLSKSYGGLPALPGVLPELEAVAHDPAVPASHGPLEGVLLSDDGFTFEALKTRLGAGSAFPVVHIASHFVLETEGGTEPYLMLGGEDAGAPDGYQLTLSKLEDSAVNFHGTRLLALSACSTAKGDVAKDGLEMDSLGMVAQQKDAEAVLATLWDVDDVSTSRVISDFYARWVRTPGAGKAEALRQAQLVLLRGTEASASPDTDYSHPYYWAPFVLIGNYK